MKKRPSESTRNSEKTTRRRRKYDEEFKQQALAMVRNGQSPRSVAEALGISENLIHRWKRAARALPQTAEDEIERLRQRLKQCSPVPISKYRGDELGRSPHMLSLSLECFSLHHPLWLPTMKR